MFSLHSLKPALLFACAGTLTTLVLHLPTAHHRLFLPLTLLVTAWSLASVDDATSAGPPGLDLYTGITCLVFIGILPRILFFQEHSLSHDDPKGDKPGRRSTTVVPLSRSSVSAACRVWNNPRNLTFSRPDPAAAPYSCLVLARFAIFRAAKAGMIILIHYLVVQNISERLTASSSLFHFTPDQEPILRRLFDWDEDPDVVSSYELLLRAFMSVSWIWANILVLESYHALLSITFVVILRLDDPEDWPPLFGSLADAWTVRRFWGRFWHRIVTPTFTTVAHPVARRILQCLPGSSMELERAVTALGIFFLSGVVHAVVAWRAGQGYAHLDLLFFTSNYAVILLETLVSTLARKALGKTAGGAAVVRDRRVRMVGRALGFVWVFAWFFWAVPRWTYPKILRWMIKQAILEYRS